MRVWMSVLTLNVACPTESTGKPDPRNQREMWGWKRKSGGEFVDSGRIGGQPAEDFGAFCRQCLEPANGSQVSFTSSCTAFLFCSSRVRHRFVRLSSCVPAPDRFGTCPVRLVGLIVIVNPLFFHSCPALQLYNGFTMPTTVMVSALFSMISCMGL